MKMKKKALLVGIFLFTILLFNFSISFTSASTADNSFVISGLNEKITFDGGDDDNIDDNFEDFNKRKIEVDLFENEATIHSVRAGTEAKDLIRTDISYGESGVEIQGRTGRRIFFFVSETRLCFLDPGEIQTFHRPPCRYPGSR